MLVKDIMTPDMVSVRPGSQPARIAVLSRGKRSTHEHKAHYAYSAAFSELALGARAWRRGIATELNLLSFRSSRGVT